MAPEIYMVYGMNDPPPVDIWDIWEVYYGTFEDAEVDPADPGVREEHIVLSGYVGKLGKLAAYDQAEAMRDGCNGEKGYAVRRQGYDPAQSVAPEEYYDATWDPDFDFDDGIAALGAGAETDDPYLDMGDADDW